LSTNSKVLVMLVVLFFVALAAGCSTKKEEAPATVSGKSVVPAQTFVGLYLDLQKIDRKYSVILDGFLKRNSIENGEYRLVADSMFISSHPELDKEYKDLTSRYEREKEEAFARYAVDLDRYQQLLLLLASNENPAWAESVTAGLNQAGNQGNQ